MLSSYYIQTRKYVLFLIFDLTLFPYLLCFSQPATAQNNSKILKLIQEKDKLLQQVYQLNSLKIRSVSNKMKSCKAEPKKERFTYLESEKFQGR